MGKERRSEDRRVIKTRRAIRTALLELLSSDDAGDITARDVAERALISKKTFLAHYGLCCHRRDGRRGCRG